MHKRIAGVVAAFGLAAAGFGAAVPAQAVDTVSECHEVYETGGALHLTIKSLAHRHLDVQVTHSAVDWGHKWTIERVDVRRYGARGQHLGTSTTLAPSSHYVTTLLSGTKQVDATAVWQSRYDGRLHATACTTDKVSVSR